MFLAVGTLSATAKPMAKTVLDIGKHRSAVISKVNEEFEDGIAMRGVFITGFGLLQRIMDKHEVGNYDLIKDMNGYLVWKPRQKVLDLDSRVENLAGIYEYAKDNDKGFLLIETPSPDLKGITKYPPGVTSTDNLNIDMFLSKLSEKGIPYLDARELFGGLDVSELRYKTDHHWAMPLALKTFGATVDRLNNAYGYALDPDGVFADPDNYYVEEHPDSFLGSFGVRVGKYYAGMDDLDILLPKFETNLTLKKFLKNHEPNGEFTGDFREAFIDDDKLAPDHLNKYQAFLRNGYLENVIENHLNDNGLKCLFITDSFGRPFAQYLSLCFSETVYIDGSRESRYTGNMREYVESQDADVIICMVSGHAIWNEMSGY
jgi:hypothetical protein